MKKHKYDVKITWTGNDGEGTKTYRSYRRDLTIASAGKPDILSSADPAFRGDAGRYNPEDLLLASASACHMLSYLHLCAVNGIIVEEYTDDATAEMEEASDGGGAFSHAWLRPRVKLGGPVDARITDLAIALHHKAHELCFIARSVNFAIDVAPTIVE